MKGVTVGKGDELVTASRQLARQLETTPGRPVPLSGNLSRAKKRFEDVRIKA
jgi:hypothetical protein